MEKGEHLTKQGFEIILRYYAAEGRDNLAAEGRDNLAAINRGVRAGV